MGGMENKKSNTLLNQKAINNYQVTQNNVLFSNVYVYACIMYKNTYTEQSLKQYMPNCALTFGGIQENKEIIFPCLIFLLLKFFFAFYGIDI